MTDERADELQMDARVEAAYGPEPLGTDPNSDGCGVIVTRVRWPKQAGHKKGDRVVLRADLNRHHRYAKAHVGTEGVVVGFSRERANFGYSAACGGNKVVVHWLVDDTLTKVRVSDLKLAADPSDAASKFAPRLSDLVVRHPEEVK